MAQAATITRPTDAEAGAYALSLFEGQNPLIWAFATDATVEPGTVEVELYADGLSSEGDGSGPGWAKVVVWYEADGSVYGEW
jgi:hypothetical protein